MVFGYNMVQADTALSLLVDIFWPMTGLVAFEFPNSPFGGLRIKPQGLRQWKFAPSGALHAPVWVPQKSRNVRSRAISAWTWFENVAEHIVTI
jgi:hypothetical protein